MSKPLDFNITLREKDNGWQVILSYKDLSGKWRQKSKQGFPGQRAAKRYGDELLEQVKEQLQADKTTAAIPPELQDITLREFAPIVFHARKLDRLPNNLFTENANTEVGSDLIILQKNSQKESLRGEIGRAHV